MTDLHYRAQNENKLPAAILTIFASCALLALVLSSAGLGYPSIFQSASLLFGAIAIFFGFRYYLSYRTYHLTQMNGRQVLTVTDTQGKRISTVFYLYLDEVEEFRAITRKERKCLPKIDKTFVFTNTLRAKKMLAIDADTELGKIRLLLGTDAPFESTFARAFSERLASARADAQRESLEEEK